MSRARRLPARLRSARLRAARLRSTCFDRFRPARLRPGRAWSLRFVRLNAGLALMGFGIAGMVNAGVGLGPLEVLGQGIAIQTGITIGRAIQLCGLAVIVLGWVGLRVRPGLGTVLNMGLVGLWTDLFLASGRVPVAEDLGAGVAQFALGTVVMAAATGLYVTARLGAGPNDGLMMGLADRFGVGVGRARMGIEAVMLAGGSALGGSVGVGTVLFVLAIGPLVGFFLRLFGPRGADARA